MNPPHLLAMEDLPIPYRLVDNPPTKRQAEVLQWITEYWRDNQQSPCIRDIMKGFGFVSPNAVATHIKPLVARGLIEITPDSHRAIWPAGLRAVIKAAVTEFMTKQGG